MSGARLWMKIAMAIFLWLIGMCPYTSNRSNTKNGLQQMMNTENTIGFSFKLDKNRCTPCYVIAQELKTENILL